MKITRIRAYGVNLPVKGGRYSWSKGKSVTQVDSTIVRIDADSGMTGWGEVCPLGSFYLPAFAAGARTAIAEMGPHLLGLDPTGLDGINRAMDIALKGHPYAKCAVDIACWDLTGKAAGLPVAVLLGGRFGYSVPCGKAVSLAEPARMAAEMEAHRADGYRRFQLKVGDDPEGDIARIRTVAGALRPGELAVADANCAWTRHEAMRVARAVAGADIYLEQPCETYGECLSVRRMTALPFVLDEVLETEDHLLRALDDGAMDVVGIKLSRIGGLTKGKRFRDLCAARGIAMMFADSWGSDIMSAAIAHLAHSTPEHLRLWCGDFRTYVTVTTADGGAARLKAAVAATEAPGLGLAPRLDVLGEALADVRA
ncbi:MAG: mandelate racemase/muconate lactonizing enzyme family protein [Alphaproteobacteria bacterium]